MRYPIGKRITGKVVSLTDYGAFVELEPGIEGLIHVSEMSWTKRIKHPSKVVAVGDKVEAVVLDVDERDRKISLGMKQIEPNPWSVIEEKYPVGTRVTGHGPQHHQLRRLRRPRGGHRRPGARLGHLVDRADQAPAREVQEGRQGRGGRAQDRQGEREVLARHQAAPAEPLGRRSCGSTRWAREVTGTVTSVTDFGAFVQLEEGIEGLIYNSELAGRARRQRRPRSCRRASRSRRSSPRRPGRAEDLALDPALTDREQREALKKLAAQQAAQPDDDARRPARREAREGRSPVRAGRSSMTKSGLIEAVAERTPHISKKDTEIVVNTIFDSMAEALREGERIEIRGFGSFQVKVREAREGRNPKTGRAGAHPGQAHALLQGGQGAEGDGGRRTPGRRRRRRRRRRGVAAFGAQRGARRTMRWLRRWLVVGAAGRGARRAAGCFAAENDEPGARATTWSARRSSVALWQALLRRLRARRRSRSARWLLLAALRHGLVAAPLPQADRRPRGRDPPAAQPAARPRSRAPAARAAVAASAGGAPRAGRLARDGWLRRALAAHGARRESADAALRAALLAVLDRDLERAERAARRDAVRLDSNGVEPYLALARLYRMRGEIGRAIRVAPEPAAAQRSRRASRRSRRSRISPRTSAQGGFLQRAIASYEEVLRATIRSTAARCARWCRCSPTCATSRARSSWRSAWRGSPAGRRRTAPGEAELLVRAALSRAAPRAAATTRARAREARAAPRPALACAPGSLLGEIEAERGRTKAALAAWSRVPALDRRAAPRVYPRLEATYAALEPRARLRGLPARSCSRERPDDPHARLALARALAARGEVDEAIAGDAPRCSSAIPDDLEVRGALGPAAARRAARRRGRSRSTRELLDVLERRGLLRRRERARRERRRRSTRR